MSGNDACGRALPSHRANTASSAANAPMKEILPRGRGGTRMGAGSCRSMLPVSTGRNKPGAREWPWSYHMSALPPLRAPATSRNGVYWDEPIMKTMSEGQRAYEMKRAAKAGMSLEKWLAEKARQEQTKAREAEQAKAQKAAAKPPGFFARLLEKAQKPL
jgi:hypothetical protein